jgi:ATP-dependent Clp protease, protease subunit
MIQSKYIVNPYLMEDDEDEKPKDEKQEQVGAMMMKKMEKMFFEKRAVYLWGPVEDKSAKEVVTKL